MPFAPIRLTGDVLMPGISFGTGSDWRKNPRTEDDDGVARELVDAVKEALAAGFRAFDTAEAYKNEKSLGVALQESGVPREELFLTSKILRTLDDPASEVRRQLALLQTTYLDLFLIHSPKALKDGLDLVTAWKSLEALVDEGLVRAIGVSNFEEEHFEQFIAEARIKPAVNQISMYPYISTKQFKIVRYCQEHGIIIQTYEVSTPLIREGEKDGPLDPVLSEIILELKASSIVATPGQLLLAWAAAKGYAPVSTSTKGSRMREYIAAGELKLSPAQVAAIDHAGKVGAEGGKGKYWSW